MLATVHVQPDHFLEPAAMADQELLPGRGISAAGAGKQFISVRIFGGHRAYPGLLSNESEKAPSRKMLIGRRKSPFSKASIGGFSQTAEKVTRK